MNTQKKLILTLCAISVLSEKLKEIDPKYRVLSEVSKQMAILEYKKPQK